MATEQRNRALNLEARINLRKLYDSAVSYYESEHSNRSGDLLPSQYPVSTPLVPNADCCVQGGKCRPNPSVFEAPSWEALIFSVDDPHYYQYQFVSSGIGKEAKFLARAVGDPTCTGKREVWEIQGAPGGRPSSHEMVRRVK